jgi:putative ABC transport system substrate-binding protein
MTPASDHAKQSSQAVVQMSSAFFSAHRQVLVERAMHNRLPVSCEQPGFVALGCLVSYGPDFADFFRRAAGYVDRILKGAKPEDLPLEQPTKFQLIINLKTAKALGLTIPPTLLARADEVIE